ncbi:glycosyltransferase family 4 protein [Sphingobacterium olei]|uniref:Glycosyltransferase family 4 protein n=1 Tax=Sphingobacterium olei TaxID=2571155 RepID=A0A4U0NYE8_9SPHI|nr:glycosyltransferase [Sphingobacterium olei]TJZ59886.1 glycosyltransferase family 4 protein [Sphingobacterium olei]
MRSQILILVKNLTSGGAEKQSVLLAKALDSLYDIHYVILNADYQEPKYLKLLGENPSIIVVAFRGSLFSRFYQLVQYLKKNRIEIIFSYLTAANFFAIVSARFTGIKRVYTGIRNAYLPPFKAFVDRFLCNRMASGSILNCYSGEKYFTQHGFDINKMLVIPNCFEKIANYKEKRRDKETVDIISVGRFVEQKDYFTALNVINLLRLSFPNIRYHIVGYGEMEGPIRSKIQELGIDTSVEIYINPNNITELLNNADIYMSTSLFEGTSNSIMEAMNADLPIVATDVGDNYQLIRHNKTGFLTAVKDVESLSSYLMTLIANEDLRILMGQNSKIRLKENYSVDRFRERYQQLIEEKL